MKDWNEYIDRWNELLRKVALMKVTGARPLVSFSALVCLLSAAGGVAQASPDMEWALIGPYQSVHTCEQARDQWPVSSQPCQQHTDGAYFYGLRQAG